MPVNTEWVPIDPVTQMEVKEPPYLLVLVNESHGAISVESFESRSDMVVKLRRLIDKGYRAFVFQGRRLGISKGPHRFLLDGDEQIPLFEIKMVVEEDDTGSLDNTDEAEQDPTYRAITRKGLDVPVKLDGPAIPQTPFPTPPADESDNSDD
jgi:hypothetical protein